MNYIDIYVIEIKSEPYFTYEKWWIDVSGESYGIKSNYSLMFDSKEECEKIKIGYKFIG